MNKGQQSSGANGGELGTVLLVVLALLLSEVFLRSTENMLSGNIAHVNEIADLVADYDSGHETSFIFLGNSLANNSVDLPLINQLLPANGVQASDSAKLVPDGTTIWSWSCVLNNQFFDNEIKAGVVVLGFGWNQLSDQSRILPTSLGAFFCSTGDLLSISKHKALSSADAGEFLTAKSLRIYAHRETIRNEVLGIVVPHYETMTQSINRQQRVRQDSAIHDYSYSVLNSLIDSLRDNDSRLIVFAIPVRDNPYEIEHGLQDLLETHDIPLLDYRNLNQIDDSSFIDDMHLNPDGAIVLSTKLAKDLSAILAPSDQLSHR